MNTLDAYLNKVSLGDCLQRLKELPDNCIDSCVTDPPYGINFMSKHWDYDVPKAEVWAEVLRVLKPGGYLLSFFGTRTYHRGVIQIEDAGFEIRDQLAWLYASGFPKGIDVAWEIHKKACRESGIMVEYDHEEKKEISERDVDCSPQSEYDMRFVRAAYLQTPVYACHKCGQVLQPFMSEQEAQELRSTWQKSKTIWPEQPCMERRDNLETAKGELQRCEVCSLSHGIFADGAKGPLCNGTPSGNGEIPWQIANKDGSRPSYRPQSSEQFNNQSNAIRLERCAQTRRGSNVALKPAQEPIVMARKAPEGTIAENVAKWGTGALNIDACRIGDTRPPSSGDENKFTAWKETDGCDRAPSANPDTRTNIGRWPANVLHDGSPEVLAAFPEAPGQCATSRADGAPMDNQIYGAMNHGTEAMEPRQDDTVSASRFFYCAKASRQDRDEDLAGLPVRTISRSGGAQGAEADGEDYEVCQGIGLNKIVKAKNHHPTVKPTELMQYLCRLVTPPHGIVLDPYAGSGSTGKAALLECLSFIGFEREAEYIEIANARMKFMKGQAKLF